jgi:uncharacterized protein (DUF58 family)
VASSQLTFALVSRRRLVGLAFGAMHSARRGIGSDIAGSRPYRPGDDVDTIDWAASAKLSAARGQDEFVVRERHAEEAPYVVCVCDRRPEMAHMAPPLPWLSKPAATRAATGLIYQATANARGFIGHLDHADGATFWRPPTSERNAREIATSRAEFDRFEAPSETLALALAHLAEHRRVLPAGSFVFLLSDFLQAPSNEEWLRALEHRWDIVPVVIQDPIWEQSFPEVDGLAFPFADALTGRVAYVRLTAEEATELRERNVSRLQELLDRLRGLGLEPILLSSADPDHVLVSFARWTEQRLVERGRGW